MTEREKFEEISKSVGADIRRDPKDGCYICMGTAIKWQVFKLGAKFGRESESRLTSGLRELAEKWIREAESFTGHTYKRTLREEKLKKCADEVLALIPEATKPERGWRGNVSR
jgi:hypothetical protein